MIPFRPHHSWWVQLLLLIWRWTPELLLLAAVAWYWHRTSEAGWPTPTQIAVPMALLAPVVIWPRTRFWILGIFWLLVTRHRLRQYFLQCGAYNRSGRLPWLTLAYPTPVGERVWVWLVAGLSLADFESDTAQIAVACWARDCRVGRARRLAGLVWVDVIRRDPLTASRPYPSTLLDASTTVPAPSSVQFEDLDRAVSVRRASRSITVRGTSRGPSSRATRAAGGRTTADASAATSGVTTVDAGCSSSWMLGEAGTELSVPRRVDG